MTKQKNLKTIIAVIIILSILSVLGLFKFEAEFFDIFGLIIFGFLVFIGGWMLGTQKEAPNYIAWIIITIGILGILVDGGLLIKAVLGK